MLKGNQQRVKRVVDEWIEGEWEDRGGRPAPDEVRVEKGHGRIERRELWWVEAEELGAYLEQEYDWPGVRVCGRIRRYRRATEARRWEEVEEHTWISSMPVAQASPDCVMKWLRGHWGIENGVYRVRDVSYDEDRLHGRKIGYGLSSLRNGALNLIRHLGYRFVPDAWRAFAEFPERLLMALIIPLC